MRLASLGTVVVASVLFGVLIASNLDFSPPSQAQVPANIAQTGAFPVVESDGELVSPFVAVVDLVSAAVVNISARSLDVDRPWWHRGGQFATSLGSGFFFREDGYILTNNHVIKDAVEMTVRTASGYEYEARLVGSDPQTDLAVIKVEPEEEITIIAFGNSDKLKVGDWAIAIGNPFPRQGLDRSVTVGIISAKGRSQLRFGAETPFYQNYIQTDAAINPGNSGGPLLNIRGECIGVNAAISSPTGSSVGIGFAIPIDLARAIVPDLIESGHASRGWLGVWLSPVTEKQAKRQGLDAVRGVMIDSVFKNSPAQAAGIRGGDIIIGFNRSDVANGSQFSVLVSTVRQGNRVPVEIVRDGQEITVYTEIADRETFLASVPAEPTYDDGKSTLWLGMEVINYTAEIAREIGDDSENVTGVYVTRVYPGTPADRASIAVGSIIMKVEKREVNSIEDIQTVAREFGSSKTRIPMIVQEPDGAIARKVIRQ